MNTTDKMNMITDTVTSAWENSPKIDAVCAAVYGEFSESLTFSEIHPIVKRVLIDNGLIIPLADRKTNAEADAETWILRETYDDMMGECASLAYNYDVPAKWMLGAMKAEYKNREINVPRKPNMSAWQRAMVKCLTNNPDASDGEIETALTGTIKNADKYVTAYADFARALINAR